ncbi:hypothetical protein [Aristophania vespae]|nr:hypothetical protein [Aristophania vespae]
MTNDWSKYQGPVANVMKIDPCCRNFGDWAVIIQAKPFLNRVAQEIAVG